MNRNDEINSQTLQKYCC